MSPGRLSGTFCIFSFCNLLEKRVLVIGQFRENLGGAGDWGLSNGVGSQGTMSLPLPFWAWSGGVGCPERERVGLAEPLRRLLRLQQRLRRLRHERRRLLWILYSRLREQRLRL